MSAPVYLDNAATTPVDPRVARQMSELLLSEIDFGNPSSTSHPFGERAAAAVAAARAQVAASVGAQPPEVVFTSGATEADNLAIFGVARYYQNQGRHLVTARTEHKAVLDAFGELARQGFEVTWLEPDARGLVSAAQVAAALRSDTVLVSLMLVNNEIGVVQDVAAVARACRAQGQARLHVDAAQAVGKLPVDFAALDADLMSLSAHKAYGPKGVGALVVSCRGRGVHLKPLQFGGGQERGLRSGTLPTHQIVGMATALSLASAQQAEETVRIRDLQAALWRGIEPLGGVLRNGDALCSVPHILNVSFEGVEGESLLAEVSRAIAVSTGSACTSASAEASYVLRALGRSERLSESSLRFGLGRFTTAEDVDIAVGTLRRAVPRLRGIAGHAV